MAWPSEKRAHRARAGWAPGADLIYGRGHDAAFSHRCARLRPRPDRLDRALAVKTLREAMVMEPDLFIRLCARDALWAMGEDA